MISTGVPWETWTAGFSAVVEADNGSLSYWALAHPGVAVLLTAFANADNDVRDYDIDCIAHPSRPLPSGRLSLHAARVSAGRRTRYHSTSTAERTAPAILSER